MSDDHNLDYQAWFGDNFRWADWLSDDEEDYLFAARSVRHLSESVYNALSNLLENYDFEMDSPRVASYVREEFPEEADDWMEGEENEGLSAVVAKFIQDNYQDALYSIHDEAMEWLSFVVEKKVEDEAYGDFNLESATGPLMLFLYKLITEEDIDKYCIHSAFEELASRSNISTEKWFSVNRIIEDLIRKCCKTWTQEKLSESHQVFADFVIEKCCAQNVDFRFQFE